MNFDPKIVTFFDGQGGAKNPSPPCHFEKLVKNQFFEIRVGRKIRLHPVILKNSLKKSIFWRSG